MNDIDRLEDDISELENRIADLENETYNKYLVTGKVKITDYEGRSVIETHMLFVKAEPLYTPEEKFIKYFTDKNIHVYDIHVVEEI